MEEATVKEESQVKEGLNQVHDDVELQQQQPEPSCVDSLMVEMQKFVGAEKPNEIGEGQDGSAPSVGLEAVDDGVSNLEPDVQRESEVCVKVENDKVVGNMCPESEVCLKVENDKAVSNGESDVRSESEVAVKVESDKVVGNADTSVHPESAVGVKVKSDKVISNVDSDVQRESEVAVMVESDKVISNVNSDVQRESEVAVMVDGDKGISNLEYDVQRESEVAVAVESDKVVGDADSNMHPESEVAVAVENDSLVENVDSSVHQESEVCVETPGEENGKKEVVLKDVPVDKPVELGGGVATGEPDGNADQTAQAAMEIDDIGREGKTIQDGMASKANEEHTAKVDVVVSQVEPDMCGESGVAKEKLTDEGSSKANPSSKPLTNAEVDSVYSKLENIVPHDSKIAKEKLVDAASRKTKHSQSPSGPPSVVKQLKANHVFKVERGMPKDSEVSVETESESDDENEKEHALTGRLSSKTKFSQHHNTKEQLPNPKVHVEREVEMKSSDTERTFMLEPEEEGNESGTEEEQAAFMREVDKFHKEKHLEFKPPKFYKEELNLLKLWRAVIKLGGYEKVTACKLWRQIGESFNPPKTCTTVSWTFRIFYEKALVEFEKYRWHGSELALPESSRAEIRADGSGSGRTLRDAAARAMQGWHSQRLTGNGEEKQLSTTPKMDKQLKSSGLLKRKKFAPGEYSSQVTHMRATKPRLDMTVIDIGPPADWVKINVKRFSDCFEVYALVPGLLREEVHVQSDPIGRLIITGQPMQLDNPWGVTPFKKVVSLPSRIDPHQTSAVVTLNGQLFVRVPLASQTIEI